MNGRVRVILYGYIIVKHVEVRVKEMQLIHPLIIIPEAKSWTLGTG